MSNEIGEWEFNAVFAICAVLAMLDYDQQRNIASYIQHIVSEGPIQMQNGEFGPCKQ